MIEFTHLCERTNNIYRTRIPLTVRFELRYYAPCNQNMYVWIDANNKDVGGGTLESEMIEFEFLDDSSEIIG